MFGITIVENNIEINIYCDGDEHETPEWSFDTSFDGCQNCFNTFHNFDLALDAAKKSVAEWINYYKDLGMGGDVPFLDPVPEFEWNSLCFDDF